jgi:hypothetical protein
MGYTRKTKIRVVTEPSFTIPEFCAAERISKPTYYKERDKGRGPKEYYIGNCVRISPAARLEWHERKENGEFDEDTKAQADTRRAKSRRAVAKAITSPNHISNPKSAARAQAQARRRRPRARAEA